MSTPTALPPGLHGTTLILPTVLVGNVPQLAADLLIHTYRLNRVATPASPLVHPFAGPGDGSAAPALPLELYHSPELGVCVMQQRLPVLPGCLAEFVRTVAVPVAAACGRVVVADSVVRGSQSGYAVSSDSLDTDEFSVAAQYVAKAWRARETDIGSLALSDSFTAVLAQVYEGDNYSDALGLAERVVAMLGLPQREWTPPPLWSALYGTRAVPTALEEGMYV